MRRFILLNNSKYPEDFLNVEIDLPDGTNKQSFVENKIIEQLNAYNPKLCISAIEYMPMNNIRARFPKIQSSVYTGGIIEERFIEESEKSYYEDRGWTCELNDDNNYYAYYILMYVFVSHAIEEWRNSFISQTFFPAFSGYMNAMVDASCIAIADKPILYINIVYDEITAPDILRPLKYLIGSGQLQYCSVFNTEIYADDLPTEMKAFIRQNSRNFPSCYNEENDIYSDDYVVVDFSSKELTIKPDNMAAITNLSGNNVTLVDNSGSKEKFYLKEIIPVVFLAKRFDYTINISQYSLYIEHYTNPDYSYSEKMDRMINLLAYFRKLV